MALKLHLFSVIQEKSRIREKSISRPMRIVAPIPKNPDGKEKLAEKKKGGFNQYEAGI